MVYKSPGTSFTRKDALDGNQPEEAASAFLSRLREWWDTESGKQAFMPKVRALIDRKLGDTADPPIPFNKMWSIFTTEAWQSGASDPET